MSAPNKEELLAAARKCLKEQLKDNDSDLQEIIVDELAYGINDSWDEMYEDLARVVRTVCMEASEKI